MNDTVDGSAMAAREMEWLLVCRSKLMRGTSRRGKINNEDTNKEEVNPMKDNTSRPSSVRSSPSLSGSRSSPAGATTPTRTAPS